MSDERPTDTAAGLPEQPPADAPAPQPPVPPADAPAPQTYTYKTSVTLRITPMRIALVVVAVGFVLLMLLTLLVYFARS